MKKINIIAAAMVLVLSASCSRKLEFQHETFATFDAVSFMVDETAGTTTIPVSIYNPTGAPVSIAVSGVDGSAVNGVDYEIVSPASGILNFSGEETTQNIEVSITGFVGEFTNNKVFTIQISSATEGVSVGNYNEAKVTIKDLDHPLSAILGQYTAAGTENWDGAITWPVVIDKDDNDVTAVQITNFLNLGETLAGSVSDDMTVITVPFGQEFPYGQYIGVYVGFGPGGYYTPSGNLILTATENGWVQTTDVDDPEMLWGAGCLAADASTGSLLGWLTGFAGGTVLTLN